MLSNQGTLYHFISMEFTIMKLLHKKKAYRGMLQYSFIVVYISMPHTKKKKVILLCTGYQNQIVFLFCKAWLGEMCRRCIRWCGPLEGALRWQDVQWPGGCSALRDPGRRTSGFGWSRVFWWTGIIHIILYMYIQYLDPII